MAFKSFLITIAAATMLFAATTISAPVTGSDLEIRGPPGSTSGGSPGHHWNSHDITVTWPTDGHSLKIVSNVTQDMPGWEPSWAPASSKSGVQTSETTAESEKIVGNGARTHVINNCASSIYVHTSRGPNGPKQPTGVDDPSNPTGTYEIAPKTTYVTGMRAVKNGAGGVSVKLGTSRVMGSNIYQIEYTENANSAGQMGLWYDLSKDNGDPFVNYPRHLQIGQSGSPGRPSIYNAAGSEAESYPYQKNCATKYDLWFWLC